MKKTLRRSSKDCKLCGVCGGIGEYFGVDPNLIRLIWAGFALIAGSGIILYIIAAVILPKAEDGDTEVFDQDRED